MQIEKREVNFKNKEGNYIIMNKEFLQLDVRYFAINIETKEEEEVDEVTCFQLLQMKKEN